MNQATGKGSWGKPRFGKSKPRANVWPFYGKYRKKPSLTRKEAKMGSGKVPVPAGDLCHLPNEEDPPRRAALLGKGGVEMKSRQAPPEPFLDSHDSYLPYCAGTVL
jgi:hypothetical protein